MTTTQGFNMTACTAHNASSVCPQRHTCQLYRNYLEASGVVSLVGMPVSASEGCYMWRPIEIKMV